VLIGGYLLNFEENLIFPANVDGPAFMNVSINSTPAATPTRSKIVSALLFGCAVPIAGYFLCHILIHDFRWNHVPTHSLLEALGLFAGVLLASLLLLLRRYNVAYSHHLWTICGLLAMGVLDGFHAASPPGKTFVWLHSMATFSGGLFFAMVWMPVKTQQVIQQKPLALLVLSLSLLIGAGSILWPSWIPAMADAGGFTYIAIFLNSAGGIAFLAAGLWFLLRLRNPLNSKDYLFAVFALLFGMSGVFFASSTLWDGNWWLWHLLRLSAYIVALRELFRLYNQTQVELRDLNLDLEKRVAERVSALQESESHIRAILHNTAEGIITSDSAGIVLSFNPAAVKIFGFPADEIVGKNFSELVFESNFIHGNQFLPNFLQNQSVTMVNTEQKLKGKRKDNSVFPLELVVSEMHTKDGAMFIVIARDISLRHAADKMKSEFVSTVSHELRTPLTSIVGALGLIVSGKLGELPKQALSMINIAHRNGQRLNFLISDLLDIEKLDSGKMHFDLRSQSVREVVQQTIESNQTYSSERGVRLELIDTTDDGLVMVDNQRLMQVLSNLFSNALKYSPDGGTVEVAIHKFDAVIRLEVRDYGSGIPLEFRDRIFGKFAQADSSDTRLKGGTGLGLAITRKLVERMAGRIGFDSVIGEGSTFFIELPIWNPPVLTQVNTLPDKADGKIARILIIEDDPDIANLLCIILSNAGYTADIAGTGTQSLQLLRQSRYDAVTLDLCLPDISGLEIIRQLRLSADTAQLPIIVVSAKMEEGRLAIDGNLSGTEWLSKPINEVHLLDLLRRHIPLHNQHRLKVLHVEDDVDLHQVVLAMAGKNVDMQLATSLAAAHASIAQQSYDVLILDLQLPDGSGWEFLPTMRKAQPDARVIILTSSELSSEEIAKVEIALLKSRMSHDDLLRAIHSRIHSNNNDLIK
jgi:PAS domain S-box-containing protein